ncbi:unnamed protein product [Rhizophagus irregularis]|uniref:Uncharacterized protein n=1 Tax=Rhizophagus irregularis TaxID=588596 RepID=A0A916EHS5_9GLOM|nr:unnamed protein product [Rhizophagus irregularis]
MTRHHRKKSFLSQTQYDIRGKVTLYMFFDIGHTQGEMITLYMFFDIGQGEMINGNSSTTRTWRFSLNNPKNHKVIRKPRKNIKEATIYGQGEMINGNSSTTRT